MAEQHITIERLTALTNESAEALKSLTKQIGMRPLPLSDEAIKEMLSAESNRLLVAKVDGVIVGMVTVIIYRIPYNKKATIEDVVVDQHYRKLGLGSKLMEAAVAEAKKNDVRFVYFTSRPIREAANRLYEKLGFSKRETNYYRIDFDK